MDAGLLVALAGLALIDSTSIGTLLIPIWLLLDHRQIRPSRMIVYLATIAGFYLLVGLVLALGAGAVIDSVAEGSATTVESTPGIFSLLLVIAQLLVGVWLFAISWRFDSSKPGATERVSRWKSKAHSATTSPRVLMGLALFAAMAEVATMLPYLGAIAMITAANLTPLTTLVLMIAYCLVMITPALALLLLRRVMHERVQPLLIKIDGWITRNAESAMGWTLGIAGFLIAQDAVGRLLS